ncbi:MAG: diguanylate cyclase [Rhodanobacter sp.]|nr:MAG: diguanylate cyclase [Rhodanobacter sp.]TAM37661.1 MAG: diguanylate cyclase [Rhodanobacter sp.]
MPAKPPPAPPPVPGEAPYRLLLDEVGAFVYTTDRRGRYTYANRLVLDLLGPGLQLEDVVGKAFTDFVDIGETTEIRATDRRVLDNGETICCEESNFIHATGELRTYWSTKKPLRDRAGAIIGMLGISHDITANKRLEDAVRQQKTLLDTVLENVDALVYMKDGQRRFVYANQHLADALGLPLAAVVGRLDTEVLPRAAADAFWAKDQHILATGERSTSEEALPDASGQLRHYWSVAVRGIGPDGAPAVIGLSTDITELHTLKEALQQQARSDGLTELANRRWFFEQAEQVFAHSRRDRQPLSVIALDLDHFKDINDTWGHPAGDRVLQAFARRCLAELRLGDIFARTGGEEFGILLPATGLDAARELAERLRRLHAHGDAPRGPALVSVSLGVTSMLETDASFDALYSRADRALYRAKGEGRDRVAVL